MKQKGFILPAVLAFILAAVITGGAVLTIILNNFFVVGNNIHSQQAFNIAEAGINYYLWHLAHNGADYKDGQTTPTTPDPSLGYGPYVHNYIDSATVNEGTFTLWVKPQGSGSTIATVRSIGKVTSSTITRTVQAQIGAQSFASYGLLSDSEFWFGQNETANGPVFSNVGIHMDGSSSDTVSSANSCYTPQPNYANGVTTPQNGSSCGAGKQNGVWCDSAITSPNCTTRDKSNWLYPKPAIDFNQVSTSLCTMKKTAFGDYAATSSLNNGATPCAQTPALTSRTPAYIPQHSGSFSNTKGYLIKLNTSGTYDLLNVTGETDTASTMAAALTTSTVSTGASGLGTTGIPIPPSGVIFVEDNVWVMSNPTFHGRVTIAAGQLASAQNNADINIAGPIQYTTKNGQDSIGLVAENNIYIAPYAPPASGSFTFEVDAATLAGTGYVDYPYKYKSNSSRCTRGWVASNQRLLYYGSVSTRLNWTWNTYGGGCGDMVLDNSNHNYWSGIENTETDYDYNMLYAPPPSYPITGGYNILSWREVLTHP